MLGAVALAGCGTKAANPPPTPAARGAWSAPADAPRQPLACPVASSRALWPDRVLALGSARFAALTDRQPQLADVAADGRVLARTPLGATGEVWTRALACDREGRLAAAWIEETGERRFALRLALPPGPVQTLATSGDDPYDAPALDGVALAFAPDRTLLVVWALDFEVHAALVSPTGTRRLTLGKTNEITLTAAEIAANGRAIVAWTTIDGGEERNTARRVYAVMGERGRFGPRRLVDRARVIDSNGFVADPQASIRLAAAPDGRALLQWGMVTAGRGRFNYRNAVRSAEAAPHGRFGKPRRLAAKGLPGDVALRADGTALAVWTADDRLWARAAKHRSERITGLQGIADLSAVFDLEGRPRVEWEREPRVQFSVRRAP